MSLASLLPYDHAYAGGYPGIGSQPLPTDADALDYLSRMATADGAGVETGVAVAVDAFFRDTKAAGVFDALKGCCILAGARTLAGALVPVVGDAPTNVADGFVEGDYSRTAGLTGDGTSYLDSGRAGDADPLNDKHIAAYVASGITIANARVLGAGQGAGGGNTEIYRDSSGNMFCRVHCTTGITIASAGNATGFTGASRASSSSFTFRINDSDTTQSHTSNVFPANPLTIFAGNSSGTVTQFSDATLAFYSIGTSLSLEDLDTAVSNLITRLKFALLVGENPSGLDPDTIDYIVRGYEAGGTLE